MVENEYQSAESLCQDEAKLKFYTGNYYFVSIHKILTVYQICFPEWCIFNALLNLLSPSVKLSKYQMVLMFLMKLRLSLFNEDLAIRFEVHTSTVT